MNAKYIILYIFRQLNIYIYLFTNPSARAGYDTIFKRSLTGLNLEFSFS